VWKAGLCIDARGARSEAFERRLIPNLGGWNIPEWPLFPYSCLGSGCIVGGSGIGGSEDWWTRGS